MLGNASRHAPEKLAGELPDHSWRPASGEPFRERCSEHCVGNCSPTCVRCFVGFPKNGVVGDRQRRSGHSPESRATAARKLLSKSAPKARSRTRRSATKAQLVMGTERLSRWKYRHPVFHVQHVSGEDRRGGPPRRPHHTRQTLHAAQRCSEITAGSPENCADMLGLSKCSMRSSFSRENGKAEVLPAAMPGSSTRRQRWRCASWRKHVPFRSGAS